MEKRFKVLTGTAIQVETELNELRKSNGLTVVGMSATNESTTVIVELYLH